MSRGLRTVVDQALLDPIRAGRLRDEQWPYGLRAVVSVAVALFALTGLLALVSGPIRQRSGLTVPNSLSSSVPDSLVWVLVLLLTFCLALFTTAAVHGPWWLTTLGLVSLALLLGIWSAATTTLHGVTTAVLLALGTWVTVLVLAVVRRRRALVWWEFPLILLLVGLVLGLCLVDYAAGQRLLGFRLAPVLIDQTMSFLTFLVLPAAFAAGAAVAEIAVGVTMAATRIGQQRGGRTWPYVIFAAVVVLRLVQEVRRLVTLDPVNSGLLAFAPAAALVAAFAGLAWAVAALTPLAATPVVALPEQLGRIVVPIGAAVIALMLPVYVLIFGWQVVVSVSPSGAPGGFDPSPLVDRLVDGFRLLLGGVLVTVALLRFARRGQAGPALVLGGAGVMVMALGGLRLLTGYRWAFWLDPDAVVSVVTLGVLLVTVWLLARQTLTPDRALGLAAVLILAVVLSVRSVVADPFATLLGYTGVGFVLFGLVWDLLTGSDWANTDGRQLRRPVRVLLAVGYPLLTVTVLASDALIRRPRTFSDLNGFAELGDLVLGTALLGAAAVVVLSAVRANRPVV